jgi:hypothetical protein
MPSVGRVWSSLPIFLLLVVLLIPFWACAPGLSAQSTSSSGCLPADTTRAPARLAYLKDLVSSSDSDRVGHRQDLGLPRMNASKVVLVTKQRDCQNAVTALNNLRNESGKVRQIWLYMLGTSGYAVDDPSLDVGFADKVLHFFNSKFAYKGTISGF